MSDDKFIVWLSNLSKTDSSLVGEKGANLGEIYNAKFPVPQAFVITPAAITTILEKNQLTQKIKNVINKAEQENSKEASKEIQDLILNITYPENLKSEILEAYDHFNIDLKEIKNAPGALAILKSAREPIFIAIKSGTSSKTIINIKGNQELLQSIKEIIASSFSEEEILKHKKDNLENLPKTSIIIQKMINSDKSGIIFSKNQIENDESILIKASFGQKTSKEITPDIYTLSKNFEILNETIQEKKFAITRTASGQTKTLSLTPEKSTQRTLKTYELKQLAELGLKLEEHFKSPQKIKFAIENDAIYIIETSSISKSQSSENPKQEMLSAIPTKTSIKMILDPALFNKKSVEINPKEIGMIKLENFIATYKSHPLEYESKNNLEEYKEIIKKGISEITNTFKEKPTWIKIPSIKNPSNSEDIGIRFSLSHQDIFRTELQAIKEISSDKNNLGIILSQITSSEEIKQTQEILKEVGIPNIKLGIIIETPAASILIKDICLTGISLITFDTKNLARLTLANQENPTETSWAILKQISRVIRECKSQNIESSIHSTSATTPEMLKFLIKQKITSISLPPTQIHETSKLIHQLETTSQEEPKQSIEKTPENTEEPKKENIFN